MAKVTGGDKFKATLDKIAQRARSRTLRVGFLEKSIYPSGISVPLVAAVQEFGAPSRGIPPRPFFRQMIAAKKGEWPNAAANLLKANDYDVDKTLKMIGEAIAGQLRQSISTFVGTPLKPATIKRKGSSKQLVDTGHMLGSVDYEVT